MGRVNQGPGRGVALGGTVQVNPTPGQSASLTDLAEQISSLLDSAEVRLDTIESKISPKPGDNSPSPRANGLLGLLLDIRGRVASLNVRLENVSDNL